MPRRMVHAMVLLLSLLSASAATAYDKSAGPRPPALVSKPAPDDRPVPASQKVDINSASRAQLKTLPGIGDAEADRIVAARPYLSKTQLVEKQVLSIAAYQTLQRRVVAMQPKSPAPKAGRQAGRLADPKADPQTDPRTDPRTNPRTDKGSGKS